MATSSRSRLGETVRDIRDTSQFGQKAEKLQELRSLAERSLSEPVNQFLTEIENRTQDSSSVMQEYFGLVTNSYALMQIRGQLMQMGRVLSTLNVHLNSERCPVGMTPTSSRANKTMSFPLIFNRNGQVCVSDKEQESKDASRPGLDDFRDVLRNIPEDELLSSAGIDDLLSSS